MRWLLLLTACAVGLASFPGCRREKAAGEQRSDHRDAEETETITRARYPYVMRVKEVDVEAARVAFEALFVPRVRELTPKYVELEGFPTRTPSGDFVLNETVHAEESKRPGSKLREGPGRILVRVLPAGQDTQKMWFLHLLVVAEDWRQPEGHLNWSDHARVVFDCDTGNSELHQEVFEIAKECFKQMAEPVATDAEE